MGAALKHAFDVLNINRMQTGIDTYGQGRCPFYLEPSVIVVITDGGKLSSNAGIQEEVSVNSFYLSIYSSLVQNSPSIKITRFFMHWSIYCSCKFP